LQNYLIKSRQIGALFFVLTVLLNFV